VNLAPAVRITMLVATMAWAMAEVIARRRRPGGTAARGLYTLGIALTLVHAALAFHVVYAWSHGAAAADTARQTADLTGWAFGGGLIVNYLFLALWAGDAGWWWLAPASRAARAPRVEAMRLGVFVFMFANGAIVFAAGVGRLVGIASVGAVIIATFAQRRRTTRA